MRTALHRRTFLRGVGATMALPLLDAMGPMATAAGRKAPVRMAFVFFPNGAIMDSWTPKGKGSNWELSETLKPLQDFKSDLTAITGLAQDNGRSKGDGPGDHARCAASYLTGAHPYKTSGADIRLGISVDQAAALQVGKQTKLPSLEIGIEPSRNAGRCDSGYSCAYSSNVSWRSETTPMAKEIIPRLVFERLFGSGENKQDQKERDFYRQSILDLVSEDAQKLKQQLGATDRSKIDEYFTSVRELELRIARAEEEARKQRPDFEVPNGKPRDLEEHIRLMYDLMYLAFRTDTTRIATFMLANAGSNRAYRMVGVNDGHHQLSHHRNDNDKITKIRKIDRYLATQFAYFLKRLKETKEGTGTLLDNCMIVYGSGLSDGNRHRHENLPIVVAGSAGGTIKTNRHLVYDQEIPMNNLFLSMLDRMGAKYDKIGDSSGRLKELDA